MALPVVNHIKVTTRPPRPLPAPPTLANLVQGNVVTKKDVVQFDRAWATWWQQFQTAFDSTVTTK